MPVAVTHTLVKAVPVELAVWDLEAKLRDEPACATIARAAGRAPTPYPVSVYAAGGYYYGDDSVRRLRARPSRVSLVSIGRDSP